MIYKVEMFAGCCDNCKREVMEGADYSAYGDKEQVRDEFSNCDWIEHEGKNYCQNCFEHDDDDKVIINTEFFREPKPYHISLYEKG